MQDASFVSAPGSARSPSRRWRQLALLSALACLVMLLSGCGTLLRSWENTDSFLVAADPLCEAMPDQEWGGDLTCQAVGTAKATATANHLDWGNKFEIARVVNESEFKCGKFVNGLVLASNGTSATLDGLTTVFSTLGSVFTPLATVHALTAAAGISSGWNGVIRSDIYAKRTVENYAQAIQSSYYDLISTYLDKLGDAQETDIVVPIEVGRIRLIHKSCSLAAAQATISATLRAKDGTEAGAKDTKVTVTGALDKNEAVTLNGTGSLQVAYTNRTGGSESAKAVASKLVSQVLSPANNLAAAGVSATLVPGDPESLMLHGPDTIVWSGSGKLTVKDQNAKSAATDGSGAAGTGSGGSGSNNAATGSGAAPDVAGVLPGAGTATLLSFRTPRTATSGTRNVMRHVPAPGAAIR